MSTPPVRLIAVPYDSGHWGLRMGAGPLDLIEHGAAGGSSPVMVEAASEWRAEGATAFELVRRLADEVAAAVRAGELPLVLAGNCSTAVGTVAGLGRGSGKGVGVLWLDAHADLNTPETSTSAFLDGMALAMVTGRCWTAAAASIPGFTPVPDRRVALLGARDLDPAESEILDGGRIHAIPVATVAREGAAAALAGPLEALRHAGAEVLYLHLDLDVHDPAACRANRFAAPGGLLAEQTLEVIAAAAGAIPLGAAALTAYDPSFATDGRSRQVALAVLEKIREVVRTAGAASEPGVDPPAASPA